MNNKNNTGGYIRAAAFSTFAALSAANVEAKEPLPPAAKTTVSVRSPDSETQKKAQAEKYWVQYCEGVAPQREAYIAIDAKTGETLLSKDADAKVQIASMTKMMTVILAAEAIQDGLIKKDTMVPVETDWNKREDGRLITRVITHWKKPVPFEDHMRATIIGSKADTAVSIAVAIAKARGLGKSEAEFVKFMNKRAAELGFDITAANASGLPLSDVDRLGKDVADESKASTARTAAMMLKHIRDRHPDLFEMMQVKEVQVQGKPMKHTLSRFFEGASAWLPKLPMQGKSAFTCRSGFGAAVNYGDVILSYVGAQTPDQRKEVMTGLLKQAMEVQALKQGIPKSDKPAFDVTLDFPVPVPDYR